MKRQYRLRKNADFQKIRRLGQSRSNRLVVLIALPNRLSHSRFGFSVSKRIGKSVHRNKVKRRMRESTRLRIADIKDGWDLLFIARVPIKAATYQEIDKAIFVLLKQLKLLKI
ncbi:MAG: ribonuclease P protein component [Anaerolineaceae bacterium 4572_78]|nr:MAG: ribonuclease P protein component [Anaerolineaceae bacterium 4572_78]